MALDVVVIAGPTDDATDVVSRAELKRHMRMVSTTLDAVVDEAINDAVDKIDGPGGELNRTIRARTYTRYMANFPGLDEDDNPKPILLPYGPLIEVISIEIGGDSPSSFLVEGTDYVVKTGTLVPEIHTTSSWPTLTDYPRQVSVTYRCGETGDYPPKIKRMVKFLAAHYMENSEATINEPRQMQINRRVEFAMDDLRAALRIPLDYSDWNE